ncbi:MAG: hypothetical protein VKP63_03560 [Cyanobacteriota bacterium]|nr:hypothetical protein [Cyanobacteriota bacterium]
MCWSTCQDGLGLNIGGAYFFACPVEGRPFTFSSNHYRYLYLYTFEQIFFTIRADSDGRPLKRSPNHDALDEKKEGAEALWLHEIKYGRRIYVIIESETALEHHKNGIRSGLEWIMLSAKLQNPSFAANVQTQTRIRLQTQDNQILDSVEITDIQSTLEAYFESPCTEHPLSPLAIQVSELNGAPVSLLTTAFIDSQHTPPDPPIPAGDHGSMRDQPR